MKLSEIISAYTALGELSSLKLDAQTAFNVFRTKRELQEFVEFFVQSERKLIDEYAAKLENGQPDIRNNRVYFSGETDEERAANSHAYNDEREKLLRQDYNIVCDRRMLRIPSNIRIAPTVFEAVDRVADITIYGSEL